MIALYILLGLLLLLLLPIGVRLRFDGESRLTVRYAGIPVWRFSSKAADEREKRRSASPPRTVKKDKPPKQTPTAFLHDLTVRLREEGALAVAAYLQELARLLTTTVGRLMRTLHFGCCTVQIAVGSPDAAQTALRYGKLCGAVYSAQTAALSLLRIRRLDLSMQPDFRREKDAVRADIRLHVLPLPLLWTALCTLWAYLKINFHTVRNSQTEGQKGKGVE